MTCLRGKTHCNSKKPKFERQRFTHLTKTQNTTNTNDLLKVARSSPHPELSEPPSTKCQTQKNQNIRRRTHRSRNVQASPNFSHLARIQAFTPDSMSLDEIVMLNLKILLVVQHLWDAANLWRRIFHNPATVKLNLMRVMLFNLLIFHLQLCSLDGFLRFWFDFLDLIFLSCVDFNSCHALQSSCFSCNGIFSSRPTPYPELRFSTKDFSSVERLHQLLLRTLLHETKLFICGTASTTRTLFIFGTPSRTCLATSRRSGPNVTRLSCSTWSTFRQPRKPGSSERRVSTGRIATTR